MVSDAYNSANVMQRDSGSLGSGQAYNSEAMVRCSWVMFVKSVEYPELFMPAWVGESWCLLLFQSSYHYIYISPLPPNYRPGRIPRTPNLAGIKSSGYSTDITNITQLHFHFFVLFINFLRPVFSLGIFIVLLYLFLFQFVIIQKLVLKCLLWRECGEQGRGSAASWRGACVPVSCTVF